MLLRNMLLVGGLTMLTGCSSLMAYSEDFYYHDQKFVPRRVASEIRLFEGDKPERKYVVLGRIVAKEGLFGTRQAVLDELRSKAAALGADAVIDLAYGNRTVEWGERKLETTEKTQYTRFGKVSKSETRVQEPTTTDHLVLSGLAVRYTED